jgi:hypothetical protein
MLKLIAIGFFLLTSITEASAHGPLVIRNQNTQTFSGLSISTTSEPCAQIINSTNITKGSQIGPCGTNNTTSASQGIVINGGGGINIYDNYIHVENLASGCCDTHDGVLINHGATDVTIQGNVIAFNETNIEVMGGSSGVMVSGNFLLNPRGPFPRGEQFQSSGPNVTNVTVSNNYVSSSTEPGYPFPGNQEDAVNYFKSETFTAQGNYIVGGQSSSGCGILIDILSNNGTINNNLLHNTGQCGIGVADGTGHTPTTGGTNNVTISATNGAGTGSATLVLTINPSAAGFFVATNGSDANPGTLNAPFATLRRCQTAMRASGTIKICYIRGGNYTPAVIANCDGTTQSCVLDLRSADAGKTWSYYPSDGYGSASITGGSTGVGNGAYDLITIHGNNITIDGLSLHNFQFSSVHIRGGSNDGLTVKNSTIFNEFISTQTFSAGGVSCYGCSNATVSHNYIHDMANAAVTFGNVNGLVTNMVVDSNYIQNTCTAIADCGAVYLVDTAGTSTGTKWTNNYIRDGNMFAGLGSNFGSAFYTDDCTNNVTITGNVITGRNGSNGGNIFHGGKNIHFNNNLVDLSTFQQKIAAFQTSTLCSDNSMVGNQIEDNVIIGTGPGNGYQLLNGSPPNIPTIINNDYFSYAGGAISFTGAYTDLSPKALDPQLTCWTYNIAPASAVLGPPVSFFDICRTWGPPGFVVPQTGTVPSNPHAC